MAPEVREGDPATTRSDVWSLGVVLHEIFFGKRPERRNSRSVSGVLQADQRRRRPSSARCWRCASGVWLMIPQTGPTDATAVQRLFEVPIDLPARSLRTRRRRWTSVASRRRPVCGRPGSSRPEEPPQRPCRFAVQESRTYSRMVPSGEPADWGEGREGDSDQCPGHVHCFSMLDSNTARVIWGNPRVAEGRRHPVRTPTGRRDSYRNVCVGCPEIVTEWRRAAFHGADADRRKRDRLSRMEPMVLSRRHLTPGAEPLWLRERRGISLQHRCSARAPSSPCHDEFRLALGPGLGGRQMAEPVPKQSAEELDRSLCYLR